MKKQLLEELKKNLRDIKKEGSIEDIRVEAVEENEELEEVEINRPTKRDFKTSLLKKGAIAAAVAVALAATPTTSIVDETNPYTVEAKTKKDKKKPTIKFSGKSKITVDKNKVIKIPKTTAKDNKDGNVTKKMTITVKKGKKSYKSIASKIKKNKKVKFSSAGKYVITYTVKDKAGNKATKKRYITVVDPKTKNINTTEKVTTEAKTTQIPTTTEAPKTTETPTTENQTSSEYPVMPPVDLSKYGKIEKVTVNGVNYNILTEPNDEYYKVNGNANEARKISYEICELVTLAYDPQVTDYLKEHKYLELVGHIGVIDKYGVDCSNNIFIREWIGSIETEVSYLFVDSKGDCTVIGLSLLVSDYLKMKNNPNFDWDYLDDEKKICISGHLSDEYNDYNVLTLKK